MTEQTDTSSAPDARGFDIDGLKVAFSSQTYGPVDPIVSKHIRAACMFASNRGVLWTGDCSPDRMGYGAARNTAVQHMFKTAPESDGLVWVDSDIKPPIDAIARLLDTVNHHRLDFVSGVYHQRGGCHNPVFHGWNEEEHCYAPAADYPPNIISEANGCGFGFVYTSTRMLRDISLSDDFEPSKGWFPDRRDVGGFGEDLTFCYMAEKAGYQLYVDSSIQVLHQADARFIGQEDFRRKQEEWNSTLKEPQEKVKWGA